MNRRCGMSPQSRSGDTHVRVRWIAVGRGWGCNCPRQRVGVGVNVGVHVGSHGTGVGVAVLDGDGVGVSSFRSTTGRYALGAPGNGVGEGSGVSDGVGVSGGGVSGRVGDPGVTVRVLGGDGAGVCSGIEAARIANTATSNRGTTYRIILTPLRFAGRTT